MSLKRIVIFLCLIIFISYNTCFASTDSRWISTGYHYMEHVEEQFESQTIKYDARTNSIIGWIRCERKYGTDQFVQMYQVQIFLDKKTYRFLNEYQLNDYGGYQKISDSWGSELLVGPDSTVEQLANMGCDANNIARMYPGGKDRWVWVFSTDRYTCTVAQDTIQKDIKNHIVRFFIKKKVLPDRSYSYGYDDVCLISCDLQNDMITTSHTGNMGKWNLVLPDSTDEKLLNYAKGL